MSTTHNHANRGITRTSLAELGSVLDLKSLPPGPAEASEAEPRPAAAAPAREPRGPGSGQTARPTGGPERRSGEQGAPGGVCPRAGRPAGPRGRATHVRGHGQSLAYTLEHRDTASAEAFFRQAIERTGVIPREVITDHHQPYVKAIATTCPGALHIRTGLHRARGETTRAVERSHVPMRDRLRNSRGLKRTETGQQFPEGFEAIRHLRRGGMPGAGHLVPGPASHARVRAVVTVINGLGHGLRRQP